LFCCGARFILSGSRSKLAGAAPALVLLRQRGPRRTRRHLRGSHRRSRICAIQEPHDRLNWIIPTPLLNFLVVPRLGLCLKEPPRSSSIQSRWAQSNQGGCRCRTRDRCAPSLHHDTPLTERAQIVEFTAIAQEKAGPADAGWPSGVRHRRCARPRRPARAALCRDRRRHDRQPGLPGRSSSARRLHRPRTAVA
jgi:hypothetical protein